MQNPNEPMDICDRKRPAMKLRSILPQRLIAKELSLNQFVVERLREELPENLRFDPYFLWLLKS